MPGCDQELVAERTSTSLWQVVGEVAHISGEQQGSARYDANMTPTERNAAENLIYLCPNHHTLIDRQPDDWSVERLRGIKADHERTVAGAMRSAHAQAMASVWFEELEIVCSALLAEAVPTAVDFHLTMPEEKLSRNGLSESTRQFVLLGAAKAREVGAFVEMEVARSARCQR